VVGECYVGIHYKCFTKGCSVNILLRKYRVSDQEQVNEIYLLSKEIEFSFSGFKTTVIPLNENVGFYISFEESTIMVAEVDGNICGFGGNKGDYISFLFVHPKYFQKGIGRKIIEAILLDCKKPHLAVLKENIPAIKLYKSFGFEVEKEFEGVYNGIKCNCLKMIRK